MSPSYLDCNATTPLEPAVRDLIFDWFSRPANAGSRTHDFGADAKRTVVHARNQIAAVVDAELEEVLFVSGATESNNLAILGASLAKNTCLFLFKNGGTRFDNGGNHRNLQLHWVGL